MKGQNARQVEVGRKRKSPRKHPQRSQSESNHARKSAGAKAAAKRSRTRLETNRSRSRSRRNGKARHVVEFEPYSGPQGGEGIFFSEAMLHNGAGIS
jgi:hypothetical protein